MLKRPRIDLVQDFAQQTGPKKAPELKCVDQPQAVVDLKKDTVTTSCEIDLINGLDQGVDVFQRIGREIKLDKLYLKLRLYPNKDAVPLTAGQNCHADVGKIAIVYDRQPSGALPKFRDMFSARDFNGTVDTSDFVMNFPNWDNQERFLILFEWEFRLPGYTVPAALPAYNPISVVDFVSNDTTPYSMIRDVVIDLKGLPTRYSDTGHLVTSIGAGALFIIARTEYNGASQMGYQMYYASRLTYYDA